MKESEKLNDLGEQEVIRRLTARLAARDDVRTGVGDDTAVVGVEGGTHDFLLTTDPVMEGVHFRPGEAPERIGHKAVGRVLSDLAAMGGEPMWLLLNVAAPGATPYDFLERVYAGAERLAGAYGAAIVGGDTAEAKALELHVFGVGRVPRGEAVLREGAGAGDVIYVTGSLGGSGAGRHLDFEPRLNEGIWLRKGKWATAMIDVSDGLAADLRHIMRRSKLGAVLDRSAVPVSASVRADASASFDHALFEGEDYELLFAVASDRRSAFEDAWQETFDLACTRIGVMTDDTNTLAVKQANGTVNQLTGSAYEHFRSHTQ